MASQSPDHVAIVGAGFTGTLLAINLVRAGGPSATLIERAPSGGRGVAYSTVHPEHLLNVRAANMSALPDDPGHFVRWLEARGLATGFAPRRVYGDYLAELLADAVAHADGRLALVHGEAVDVLPAGARQGVGQVVRLADGRTVVADTVALAPGNLPPLVPPGLDPDRLAAGVYCADPWRGDLAAGLADRDLVLVLGTGLSMVDVALLLDARGFRGRIVALSRRGLVPRPHGEGGHSARMAERPQPTARAVLRRLRAQPAGSDWRAAVDALRPHTQGLWRAMPLAERRRFLRHGRAWWDVHRHRIAPAVAQRLAAMQEAGRLEVVAGRLGGTDGDGAIRYRARGHGAETVLRPTRVVNGTGPQGDLTRTAEPLLRALHERGLLTPDPLRIGVDVDQESRAVAADGSSSDRLLVLGPMTRGAFWEIVAVPDIRRQVWSVARRLANAQWVEGEGL